MTEREFHSTWMVDDEPAGTSGATSALFPWWSFTKTAVAICVLKLWEQGRLDLFHPLPGQPFSPHQLLQHRAGVPDYGPLEAYHEAVACGDTPWSRDEVKAAAKADQLEFAPGTGWSYSNVGYLLVRELIEELMGTDLGGAITALVTEPLGLTSARLASSVEEFALVHWHEVHGYDPRWVYHGCLIGTPVDAARLLHALFNGELLRPEALAVMRDTYHLGGSVSERPWTSHGYALGLMSGEMEGVGRALGHTGGGPGCVNAVYHFPDLAHPVTVATFTDGNDQGTVEAEAGRIAKERGG